MAAVPSGERAYSPLRRSEGDKGIGGGEACLCIVYGDDGDVAVAIVLEFCLLFKGGDYPNLHSLSN